MKGRLLLGAALSVLLLVSCVQPGASLPPVAVGTTANQVYLDCFETVWQTVDETFPDPTFGGLDWNAMHDQYEPLVTASKDDEEFFLAVNRMLWELNVSHLVVIPNQPLFNLQRALAEGSVGIDLRIIDGEAVITKVKPSSPADQAGLCPGHIIQRIDGATIRQIEEESEAFRMPPFSERARLGDLAASVLSSTWGEPGTTVSIVYLNQHGQHSIDLLRTTREGKSVLIEGAPPAFLQVESKRLEGNVGYVQFNRFDPTLLDRLLHAVDEQSDASGLIIDLRGNDGGFFQVRKALLEKLVSERTLFCSQQGRRGKDEVYLEPAAQVYDGPLVVLVDELSGSSSEEVAGGLQAIGRATVIGNRTPGKVLIADTKQLPNGALFVYPVAITRLADDIVVEGRGVIPDVEVALDRELLLQGRDSQLEAALAHFGQEIDR